MENFEILFYTRLGIILFIAILFLQSGTDKVLDFKGNSEYIKSVFENSFLNRFSFLLFISITILEVSTGVLSAYSAYVLFKVGTEDLAILALMLAGFTLLSLFAGQRFAKDYQGAAGLVPYFVLVVLGLFIFAF